MIVLLKGQQRGRLATASSVHSLVPVDGHGGTFSGTIVGGNGREFIEQQNTFAFDVPPGRRVLSASLTFPDDPNTELIGTLVDPDGNLLGSQSTLYAGLDGSAAYTHGMRAVTLDPKPGRWTFVVDVGDPVGGQALSAPYRAAISSDPPSIGVRGLPDGDKVRAGQPITATITVRDDGPGTEDVFADPRLDRSESDALPPISDDTVPLPIPGNRPAPTFLVPTQVDGVRPWSRGSPGGSPSRSRRRAGAARGSTGRCTSTTSGCGCSRGNEQMAFPYSYKIR